MSKSLIKHLERSPLLNLEGARKLFYKHLNLDDVGSQIIAQLRTIRTNSGRVKLCYHHMLQRRLLPNKSSSSKCDMLCCVNRLKADDKFRNKHYDEALELYNEALKLAPDTRALNEIYCMRAPTLFFLGFYDESLQDLKRALKDVRSEVTKSKLLLLKIQCEELIEKSKGQNTSTGFNVKRAQNKLFGISEERMKGVACASSYVQICDYESMGRGVMASEDILPGDVLVSEQPYSCILSASERAERCYYCLSLSSLYIPCETCIYVIFCNEKCRSKSWDQGHKYECPIMLRLTNMSFSDDELLSLRILLKARCQYSSLSDMFSNIKRAETETIPQNKGFTLGTDDKMIYDLDSYIPIHMLETHFNTWDIHGIMELCVTSSILLHLLKEYTGFFDGHLNESDDIVSLNESDYVWQIGGLLLHINMILEFTNDDIISTFLEKSSVETKGIGTGIYAFYNLFNHSCSPNAYRVLYGTTSVVVALQPIIRGQQIFVSYGLEYTYTSMSDRKTELMAVYKFPCECNACEDKWPMIDFLEKVDFNDEKLKKKIQYLTHENLVKKLNDGDKVAVYNIIQDLYKYIALLDACMPCRELADLDILAKLSLDLFSNL